MELILGDKAYSTWSLRPWLILMRAKARFSERIIRLNQHDTAAQIALYAPAGKVPALKVEGQTIWDSLAIAEWAAERWPEAKLWPVDDHARWAARSVVCEFHSAFSALRTECAMGPEHMMAGPGRSDPPQSEAVAADVRRLVEVFVQMRGRFGAGGPWLFGEWSIPDAFFTPVAARIRHYQIDLAAHGDTDGVARAYVDALLNQPDFIEWCEDGLAALF